MKILSYKGKQFLFHYLDNPKLNDSDERSIHIFPHPAYMSNNSDEKQDNFLKNDVRIDFNPKEETKRTAQEDNSSANSSLSLSDHSNPKQTNVNIDLCLSELLAKHTLYKLSLQHNKHIPKTGLIKINRNSDEVSKKDEVTALINNQQYKIKHKVIDWGTDKAIMHLIEEADIIPIDTKSDAEEKYEKQKTVLKQVGTRLKEVFKSTTYELSEVHLDEPKFRGLRQSIRLFTTLINKILLTISGKSERIVESDEESVGFKIRDLCNEVYNTMSSKIEEKNLDYIQTIKPDIEDIEIKAK